MENFKDLFSVSRKEYQSFVEEIKPEYRDVREEKLNTYTIATKIFSKKTGKCLCSRVTYEARTSEEERRPECYYIFELPDNEERARTIPKTTIVLETKEQVQQFINLIAKMNKEKKND